MTSLADLPPNSLYPGTWAERTPDKPEPAFIDLTDMTESFDFLDSDEDEEPIIDFG